MGRWLQAGEIDRDRFTDLTRRWFGDDAGPNPVHDLETGRISVADFERRLAVELVDESGAGPSGPERTAGMLARMFAGLRVEPSMMDVVRTARAARASGPACCPTPGACTTRATAGTPCSTRW